jgi:hypothetical protein
MPIRRTAGPLPLLASFVVASSLHAQSLADRRLDEHRVTVGGYGEIQYDNASGPDSPGRVNLTRFVVYLANAFNDKLSVRSEVEIEDAKIESGTPSGEVSVEQLFLDYRLSDAFTLRTGLLLTPIGIVNETHEPTTFNGVARPDFDHDVIPTTWRELGVGAAGSVPGVSGLAYRVYLMNGLRAEGFSADEGIREGRQEGQDASFANPSLTGRLEWARPGLKIGGSFWYGGSADQNSAIGTGTFAAPVTVLSADAQYDVGGFSFRGVVADVTVGDAALINGAFGGQVAHRISGGYVEGAYDVLRLLVPASPQRLAAFVRYENYDTQASVPVGLVRDDSLARRITTVGLTYKPVGGVVFKGDYQLRRNRAGIGGVDVFRLGVGYQF